MSETKSNKRRIITTLRARLNEAYEFRKGVDTSMVRARSYNAGIVAALKYALSVVAADESEGDDKELES
jgi:hypothetical protein